MSENEYTYKGRILIKNKTEHNAFGYFVIAMLILLVVLLIFKIFMKDLKGFEIITSMFLPSIIILRWFGSRKIPIFVDADNIVTFTESDLIVQQIIHENDKIEQYRQCSTIHYEDITCVEYNKKLKEFKIEAPLDATLYYSQSENMNERELIVTGLNKLFVYFVDDKEAFSFRRRIQPRLDDVSIVNTDY